jgi:ribosomal protein L16 Arg81 hydroxylase
MTMSELRQLLDDDAALDTFVQQTSEVSTLKELKQSIEQSNVSAAESNLIRKETIEILHAEVESLRQDLQSKLQRYKQLDESTRGMTRPPNLRDTIHDLNLAKRDALRDSEQVAEEWVKSGGDVGDFVEKFIETRMLYHTRAAKAERLSMSM